MARSVYYAAVSADGFIATQDGGVEWLEPFQSPELGYEAFLATVTAVVMGRATYEQSRTFGPWPYPGRRGLVVSRHPITGLPEGVTAVRPSELHAALVALREQTSGVLWIVGGGRAARACLDGGWIDELELYVIPRLLGDGVPLFERRDGWVRLRLLETKSFGNGIVMVRYAVERA